jgi:hypothetical protein
MTDEVDTNSYDFANFKIQQLIAQLETERVCGWCVARALMANGMDLLVATTGPAGRSRRFGNWPCRCCRRRPSPDATRHSAEAAP